MSLGQYFPPQVRIVSSHWDMPVLLLTHALDILPRLLCNGQLFPLRDGILQCYFFSKLQSSILQCVTFSGYGCVLVVWPVSLWCFAYSASCARHHLVEATTTLLSVYLTSDALRSLRTSPLSQRNWLRVCIQRKMCVLWGETGSDSLH